MKSKLLERYRCREGWIERWKVIDGDETVIRDYDYFIPAADMPKGTTEVRLERH